MSNSISNSTSNSTSNSKSKSEFHVKTDKKEWNLAIERCGLEHLNEIAKKYKIKVIFAPNGLSDDQKRLFRRNTGSCYSSRFRAILIDLQQIRRFAKWTGVHAKWVFCAVVAHELGHAIIHAERPHSKLFLSEVYAWKVGRKLLAEAWGKVPACIETVETYALSTYGIANNKKAKEAYIHRGEVNKRLAAHAQAAYKKAVINPATPAKKPIITILNHIIDKVKQPVVKPVVKPVVAKPVVTTIYKEKSFFQKAAGKLKGLAATFLS